jgi:hypothetical protein
LHDNNRYFANPLKEKNNTDLLHAWTLCCFLSAQLNTQQELPKTSNIPDISNRIFMFDTKDQKIPFYIKSEGDWQRCNLSSISEAEWYDNGKNPEELKEPLDGTDRVLMIGTVAYFRK